VIAQEKLNKLVSIATIASLIAMPIILAILGYLFQQQSADDGLRRDYVRIAAEILKDNKGKTADERALREWAVSIIDKHAPIKFSAATKNSLEGGAIAFPSVSGELTDSGLMRRRELLKENRNRQMQGLPPLEHTPSDVK